MSTDIITLKVTERKELGKAVKALRREGFVPANIYERGKESQAVSASFAEITKVFRQAGKHHPVELDINGTKRLAMIKDVDVKVGKNTISHIAFHAVKRNEKVEAEVPVKIQGDVPAEKVGLLVLQNLDTVMVEALPGNLPDELFIDGEKLAAEGDKVTVSDIKLPDNVAMVSALDTMVFSVEVPKDQIAEANAALEEMAAATGAETEEGPAAEAEQSEEEQA